jgi:hypothetical protein
LDVSPRLLLLLIVELGWVDPVFGQQAVDIGFKSVVALRGESNPKIRTLPIPPLARGVANFLTASSRSGGKELRKEVGSGEWLPVGAVTYIRKAGH